MPTVYLPTEHSEAELALAGRVVEALECSALYVTWSPRGYQGPDCEEVLAAAPAVEKAVTPATRTTQAVRGSWLSRALDRVTSFVAAVFTAPEDGERERGAGGP